MALEATWEVLDTAAGLAQEPHYACAPWNRTCETLTALPGDLGSSLALFSTTSSIYGISATNFLQLRTLF